MKWFEESVISTVRNCFVSASEKTRYQKKFKIYITKSQEGIKSEGNP
jgi:hypothetical protein